VSGIGSLEIVIIQSSTSILFFHLHFNTAPLSYGAARESPLEQGFLLEPWRHETGWPARMDVHVLADTARIIQHLCNSMLSSTQFITVIFWRLGKEGP
jgi:hypothetical protein